MDLEKEEDLLKLVGSEVDMSTIELTNDIPGVAATRAFFVPTVYDLIVGDM